MISTEQALVATKKWIKDVVIGCNFCPFAAKEVNQDRVRYAVEHETSSQLCLEKLMAECIILDNDPKVETVVIIFTEAFMGFNEFLNITHVAESLLKKEGYEGIYQIAGFHPLYRFAGTPVNDAANYTNRSIYPMLQLLREESIEKGLIQYSEAINIPDRNINFAREKGLEYMKELRNSCL